MILNYRKFNPLAFHLLHYMQEASVRTIVMYGGSSSGKTYSMAQTILLMAKWEGSSTLVMRKVGASIKDSVYQDFKAAAAQLGISGDFRFTDGLKTITCLSNKARIVFKGLDDSEKIKGLSSFKRVVMDEWSEFEEADYKQIRLRLRGMKGQQIICTFNPIKETHWIKRTIFDTQEWHDVPMCVTLAGRELPEEYTAVKSIRMNAPRTIMHRRTGEMIEHAPDTVVIQTTYLNNFWVVGSPDGTYGYYDDQCIATFEYDRLHDPDYYNVYALGEWGVIRTGSEFFGMFNRGTHTSDDVEYDPSLPVHLSIDSNVMPYISVQYWQAHIGQDGVTRLCQIDETCAGSPHNSARKAARLVAVRLNGLGAGRVFLHGDASTRAANTIDDEKRSFLDLFIGELQKAGIEVTDCVGVKNPSVAMTGEFINAVYDGEVEGVEIMIAGRCRNSIEDYMSVQKDANGAIAKTRVRNKATGQSYEEHGHLSDCKRYVVADIVREQFLRFSNRRKRNLYARSGSIRYFRQSGAYAYTRDVAYCIPNTGGRMALVRGRMCGDRWHITDACVHETSSTEDIRARLVELHASLTILECPQAYYRFVRSLRAELPDVRAVKESADIDRRIAATSDFVRDRILFDEGKCAGDAAYGEFVSALLDYTKDAPDKSASAALSGFVQMAVKFGFEPENAAIE